MADRTKKFFVTPFFPTWDDMKKDKNRMQMNPRTAVLQSESRVRVQQLVGLATVIVIFVGILAANALKQKPIDVQATFDFKRAIIGKVLSVNPSDDSFMLSYESSQDQTVIDAKKTTWTMQLIPGRSVTNSRAAEKACYAIGTLTDNLSTATPADCASVVTVGRRIVADYVFLNVPSGKAVVRSIIGER